MLDHITISVADVVRSSAFYERALEPLGIKRLRAYGGTENEPDHFGYGSDGPFLFIGQGKANGGYLHIALKAPDREAVDAFYKAALAAGETITDLPAFVLNIIPATMPRSSSPQTAAISRQSI